MVEGSETAELNRRLMLVGLAVLVLVAVSVSPWQPAELSAWQLRVLGVVTFGLILWISEALPIAVTSLAVVGALALVAPGDSDDATAAALAGFGQPAPYFLLGTLVLAAATSRSGLATRFAGLLVRGSRGSGTRLFWQAVGMVPPLAVVVPSALTRAVMLIPPYEEVFDRYHVRHGARLPRVIMLAIALVQPHGSNAILTGGSVPIVAAALIGGMSWGKWFLFMALPSYVILFGLSFALYLLYRPLHMPGESNRRGPVIEPLPPMSSTEKRTLAIIIGTTALWLTDSLHGLNPVIPALIGATAMFVPRLGTLTWREYEDSRPWSVFLVIGASLSIASELDRSGAAEWLADQILTLIPLRDLSLAPQLLVLMFVVAAINFVLTNRSAVLGITIPLIFSLAGPLGLNPMVLGLIVPIIALSTNFYPVQVATGLVTYQTRHYTSGEFLRAGLLLTVIAVLTIFFVALPWWAFLGEPVQL